MSKDLPNTDISKELEKRKTVMCFACGAIISNFTEVSICGTLCPICRFKRSLMWIAPDHSWLLAVEKMEYHQEKEKEVVMSHRPVCVKCQVELCPEKNGVGLLDHFKEGDSIEKYQIWDADLWECPSCHYQIVTGFGRGPIDVHYTQSFLGTIGAYSKKSILVLNMSL